MAGIPSVLALVADFVVAGSIPVNQNDSVAKIATELDAHRTELLVLAGVCVVYVAIFPIYLWKLYDELRGKADGRKPSFHWCWLAERSWWLSMP